MYRLLVLGAVTFTLPSTPLGAQANPGSMKARNDCRLAAQAIRTGQPGPEVQWAWDMIHACPAAGTASAAAVSRLRADNDTAHWTPAIRVGFNLRDGDLFEAALDVAGDQSATPTAREASFIVLIYQLTVDRTASFRGISQADIASGCPLNSFDDRGVPVILTPLAANAAARAGTVASTVAGNPEEPEVVRIAADCITQAARQHSFRQP